APRGMGRTSSHRRSRWRSTGRQVPPRPLRRHRGREREPGRRPGCILDRTARLHHPLRGGWRTESGLVASPVTAAAAIDIGTNSLRLLVVDGDHQRRRTRIAGLGRGLDVTGHLAPKGRQRALEILSEYRAEMDAAGVDWFRAVMTAVGRRASDARDFCQEAAAILGEEPQIISGVEEARLSYAGAIGDLDGGDWTVVDIGGGSTEIVGPAGAESFDVGSVVLTDAYLTERPASPDDLEAARSH